MFAQPKDCRPRRRFITADTLKSAKAVMYGWAEKWDSCLFEWNHLTV